MAQLQWTRLSPDQAHKTLDLLSERKDALVFSRDYTEVATAQLPFYRNFMLYRLVNYATMPTFTMTYLSDGTEFFPLDGTANPIYTANEKSPIQLTEQNVVSYLDFFFSNVQGSEGEALIIKDPSRSAFMNTLTQDQRTVASSFVRPLTVAKDSVGTLRVRTTLFYGHELITATLMVQSDGKMSFQDQRPLLSGLYVPAIVYEQARAEG